MAFSAVTFGNIAAKVCDTQGAAVLLSPLDKVCSCMHTRPACVGVYWFLSVGPLQAMYCKAMRYWEGRCQ